MDKTVKQLFYYSRKWPTLVFTISCYLIFFHKNKIHINILTFFKKNAKTLGTNLIKTDIFPDKTLIYIDSGLLLIWLIA